jgi:hypothetical protein
MEGPLRAALGDTPVVLIHGARQTGKTTLARWAAEGVHPARFLSFDDATVLSAALSDPSGFISSLSGPVVLDEVQRALSLFPAIKLSVDRDRRPGRFLLTGSAQVLLLPALSETLAGRMEIIPLWPFSQGELEGARERFLDAAFGRDLLASHGNAVSRLDLIDRALRGGFPEAQNRSPERRGEWFGSYLTTILQREVRDLARIEGFAEMPRLLTLAAARVGGVFNASDLSRVAAVPLSTLKRYLALFEATFLVRFLPAWSANLKTRLVKAPKLYFSDTGLLSHLTAVVPDRLSLDPGLAGPLIENFLVMELVKQTSWSRSRPALMHFRASSGPEVDLVAEHPDGRIVGIEVKASATVESSDFRGLATLRELAGKRFHRGIVLYTGSEAVPFGSGFQALPMGAVWKIVG